MPAHSGAVVDLDKARVPHRFDDVAGHYDLLTRFNPGYKRHLRASARRMLLPEDARVLELCCGTGLSTDALATVYPTAKITALDASEGMLERARRKPVARRVESFVLGDATDPAAAGVTGQFDGVFVAYGIRNVPETDRCLRNVFSCLRPGGVACFHEYSVADSVRARAIWNLVTCGVIIPAGMLTSPGSDIYRYLRRSVLDFDGVSDFVTRLRRLGFDNTRVEPMDGWQRGIVHSFLCQRPRTGDHDSVKSKCSPDTEPTA